MSDEGKDDDLRKDAGTRTRLDFLEQQYVLFTVDIEKEFGEAVTDWKNRFATFTRRCLVAFAFMGAFSTMSLVAGAVTIAQRHSDAVRETQRIQAQRREAAYNACWARNRQNIAIRRVLAGSPRARKYVPYFPIEPNCLQYARNTTRSVSR